MSTTDIEVVTSTVQWTNHEDSATFGLYSKDVLSKFMKYELSCVPKLNPHGIAAPTGEALKKQNGRAWQIISDGITAGDFDAIADRWKENHGGEELGTVGDADSWSPIRLWDAVNEYSTGSIQGLVGEDLQRRVASVRMATTGTYVQRAEAVFKELASLVELAAKINDPEYPFTNGLACSKFRDLVEPLDRWDETRYEGITSLAKLQIKAVSDARRIDRKANAHGGNDADASGDSGLRHVLATLMASGGGDVRKVLKVLANAGGGGGTKKERKKFTQQRLKDRSAGPPWPGATYCDVHGWCAHATHDCKTLKAKDGDGGGATPTLFKKNPDGTFTQFTPTALCSVNQTFLAELRVLAAANGNKAADYIIVDSGAEVSLEADISRLEDVVKLDGSTAVNVAGGAFKPTHRGTRRTTLTDGTEVIEVETYYAPGNEFCVAATHTLAANQLSVVIDATAAGHPMYLVPPGSRGATVPCTPLGRLWALPTATAAGPEATPKAGRDRASPSWPPHVQPIVAANHTALETVPAPAPLATDDLVPTATNRVGASQDRVEIDRDGVEAGRNVVEGSPDGVKIGVERIEVGSDDVDVRQEDTEVGALDASHVAPDTEPAGRTKASPPPTARMERYRDFRRRHALSTHERTAALARQLNVTLTNAGADRGRLDQENAIANQRARPLVPIPEAERLAPPDERLYIVADSVGNQQPLSAAGNASLQTFTFVQRGRPTETYAVASADHTAATTWLNLSKACQDAGKTVLREALAQPVAVAHDLGPEFTGGEFTAPRMRAGISAVTGTAYKHNSGLQSHAESANASVQQGMRRLIAHAAADFHAAGLKAVHYWDYAAAHTALAARTTAAARRGELSFAESKRLLPAPWGRPGVVSLLPGHSLRKGPNGKQLSDRGVVGLYLGNDGTKRIMLLPSGKIIVTTDVDFNAAAAAGPIAIAAPTLSTPTKHTPHTVQYSVDTAPPADPPTPPRVTFALSDGTQVGVGDSVAVYWSAYDDTYEGTVHEVDLVGTTAGPSFTVDYDPADPDSTMYEHPIADAEHMQVRVLAARAPRHTPHKSVRQYLTDHGDIKPDILMGTTAMPPAPPVPDIAEEDLPEPPHTVPGALAHTHALHWLYAVLDEWRGHYNPATRAPTYTLVSGHYPDAMRPVWTFRYKCNNGKLAGFKAREAIDGSRQKPGIHYHESYVGLAPVADVRLLDNYALQCGWNTYEDDWKQAYCQHPKTPRPDGKESIMSAAPGTRIYSPDGAAYKKKLHQELYGEPSAGYTHVRRVTDSLINRNTPPHQLECPFRIKQCPFQPTFFHAIFEPGHEFHGEIMIQYLHNDNLRTWSSSNAAYQKFRTWLRQRWHVTGTGRPLQEAGTSMLLGTVVTYTAHSVSYSMPGYIKRALKQFNVRGCKPTCEPLPAGFTLSKLDEPTTDTARREVTDKASSLYNTALLTWRDTVNYYAEVVSTLGWVVRQVAPTLALAHSMLGRAMHAPSVKAFKAAHRVWRWLLTRADIAVTYVKQRHYNWRNGDFPQYVMASDASFADDEHDRRSQGGYIGGLRGCAPDTWHSSKNKRLATSTYHAESIFGSAAAKQAHYRKLCLDFFGILPPGPIPLFLDNQSTVLAAGSPIRKWTPKSKAFDIDAKYIVEAVEDGIISVHYAPGTPPDGTDHGPAGFPADVMTKALSGSVLRHYIKMLQGPSRGWA